MSWLKRVGLIALQVTGILAVFQPIIAAQSEGAGKAVSTSLNFAEKIISIIMQVEIIGAAMSLTGSKKLAAAAPAVTQVVLSDIIAGKKLRNKPLMVEGAVELASAFAKILSSIDESEVTEEDIKT